MGTEHFLILHCIIIDINNFSKTGNEFLNTSSDSSLYN